MFKRRALVPGFISINDGRFSYMLLVFVYDDRLEKIYSFYGSKLSSNMCIASAESPTDTSLVTGESEIILKSEVLKTLLTVPSKG